MIGPLAARMGEGIVVSLSAEKVRELIDLSEQTDTAHLVRHGIEKIREHSHYQQEYLKMLFDLLSKEYAPDLDNIIVLKVTPNQYTVDTKGRRYNLILAASTLSVDITVSGVGTYTVALAAGWNALNVPTDAQICISTGGSDTPVLFRCTNTLMKV
jgi:hypothetical protein